MATPNNTEEQGFSTPEHWAAVEGMTPEQYRNIGKTPTTTSAAPPPKPPEVHKQIDPAPTAPQVEVGIQRNTRETVNKADFDRLQQQAPILADILRRQGYEAYRNADNEFRMRVGAQEIAREQEKVERERPALLEKINAQKKLSEAGAITNDGKLDVVKAVKGQVTLSTMKQAGYDVNAGDVSEAKKAIQKASYAPTMIPAVKPVEPKGKEQEAATWIYNGKELTESQRKVVIADYENKRDQLIKEGKQYTEEWYKLGGNPVNRMARKSGIADTVKAIMTSPQEAPQYWYKGTLISQAERAALIKQSDANRDLITKASTTKQRAIATFAADMVVPGFYTIRNWDNMSAGEKAVAIAFDVAVLIPLAGAATRGARAVATTGKWARVGAAARAVGQEAVAQAKAPFYMVVHPVETTKGLARQVANITEFIVDPRKLKEAVLTTSSGTVRLKVSQTTSEAAALKISDQLMKLAAKGERPVVIINGVKYELARSPFMKALGGGLAHATPQGEAFAEGLTVATKPGMPAREQGLFVSHEPLPRFATSTAYGKTGEKSIIYVTSPETAEKLSIATEKIYKAPLEGKVAEMERKFPVGTKLPKAKQKLTFRTGPELAKVEVWLEKPLTVKQLAKLKAEGFIEEVKGLFRPAISITGSAQDGAATAKDMKAIANVLDDTQANRAVARSLDRNAARVISISRDLPRATGSTAERVTTTGERTPAAEAPARVRETMGATSSRERIARSITEREFVRLNVERPELTRTERRVVEAAEEMRARARTPEERREAERIIRELAETARDRLNRKAPERARAELTPARRAATERTPVRNPRIRAQELLRRIPGTYRTPAPVRATPPPRVETPPRVPPRVPVRVPPPKIPPEKPPKIGKGATDEQKRAAARLTPGAVTWNMGKLGTKAPKDVWWVKLPGKKPYVVMGAAPAGAKILADGPGSARETTQTIGGRRRFTPFEHKHGAVKTTIRPAAIPKGARADFSPSYKSIKRRGQYFTNVGGGVAISRNPLGRKR